MSALRLSWLAQLRRFWRGWLALALCAGLAGGAVIATAAAARRTDSASRRYAASIGAPDADVATGFFYDGNIDLRAIARLPQVESSSRVDIIAALVRSRSGQGLIAVGRGGLAEQADLDPRFGVEIDRWKLVSGRASDPSRPGEAVADTKALRLLGVRLGDRIRLRLVTRRAFPTLNPYADPETTRVGPLASVRIVGVNVRAIPDELPGLLYLTPAFYRAHRVAALLTFQNHLLVRLVHGAADLPAFQAGVRRIAGNRGYAVQPGATEGDTVQASIHVQAQALWAVSALGALVTLLLVGQALARRQALESADNLSLRALGMTRSQRSGPGVVRSALIGVAAGLVAVAVAVLLSPLSPLGRARELEPHPGLALDPLALALGAGGLGAALLLIGAIASWRGARGAAAPPGDGTTADGVGRRAAPAERLAHAGLPPSLVAGARMALGRGSRGPSGPALGAISGAALAVAVIAAAAIFSASLSHLFATPRLYGQSWDYEVPAGGPGLDAKAIARLRADPDVAAAAVGTTAPTLTVDGRVTAAVAMDNLKGAVPPTVIEGRAPVAANEVLLGSRTLAALGKHIGDVVRVAQGPRSIRLRVVGRGVLSPSDGPTLGDGAAMTFQALRRIIPKAPMNAFQVRLAPGVDRGAALGRLERTYQFAGPVRPSDVGNFGGIDALPATIAALFGVAAAAALVHALVTSIRRQRRDLAILKTLGFTRRQVGAAVAWQATTVTTIGLLIGLALGIAAGRWAWTLFADQLGVVSEPVLPVVPLLLLVPGALVAANLVSAIPGWLATRTRPARVLRAE